MLATPGPHRLPGALGWPEAHGERVEAHLLHPRHSERGDDPGPFKLRQAPERLRSLHVSAEKGPKSLMILYYMILYYITLHYIILYYHLSGAQLTKATLHLLRAAPPWHLRPRLDLAPGAPPLGLVGPQRWPPRPRPATGLHRRLWLPRRLRAAPVPPPRLAGGDALGAALPVAAGQRWSP